MATASALQYISKRIESASSPEERATLTDIKDLYEKKLWHQLTEKFKAVVETTPMSNLRELYDEFLKSQEAALNPVSLVQIASIIVRRELESSPKQALAFLEPMLGTEDKKETVFTKNAQSHVLLLSHIAYLQLRDKDQEASKKTFEKASQLVDHSTMSPPVYSVYYRCAAEYYKEVGPAVTFFKNALQFLAYTPAESLSVELQRQWAFDIGIAALVGVGIYNFGEVLSHGIIQSLSGTEHEWLMKLLEAFSRGNLDEFDAVCKQSLAEMKAQPALVANDEFLKQKITILALLELAFSRSLEDSISFADVEKACRLPPKDVEYLLMRAMSLGLIKGVIDNVEQCFTVTRVRPRVLGREPIGEMAQRLQQWCGKVENTLSFVDASSVGIAE